MTLLTTTKPCFADLGSAAAQITLYLPKPPLLREPSDLLKPVISHLIADNGNHWRKILTILAKLACGNENWKSYRDNQLLQRREMICFAEALQATDGWHLIAGKATWARLGFGCGQFTPLDRQGRVFYRGQLVLTPYPDYRQFPNELIDQVIGLMKQPQGRLKRRYDGWGPE